jgi:S-DNA-T family DNA segregation ATPase FtsK/SpoIIIE
VDDEAGEGPDVDLDKRDEKFEEAARLVVQFQQGSTSLIQRKLSLGYNRAGRIVDQLEAAGILGPFEGSKARQVLIKDEFSLEQILNDLS